MRWDLILISLGVEFNQVHPPTIWATNCTLTNDLKFGLTIGIRFRARRVKLFICICLFVLQRCSADKIT